ncbi:RNA polymerase sigma factor, partial [Aliarcobacter butzleri]|uniref:RNA polymerase sigma factor n=1 Tax=Aliarcobacter butzleri TaxID=28197 RepID=UPI003AF9B342
DVAVGQNEHDILMKELRNLPTQREEAFVLHILEGYAKEEIANIMNISYLAVAKHISRASIELREKLGKKEEI